MSILNTFHPISPLAPLRLLQIDADAGDALGALAPSGSGCELTRVSGVIDARRALELHGYDLIVLDPGAVGDAASVVLLDTLPAANEATPVLLYCDYLPSEACRDRANLLLLKSTAAQALWAMIRALAASNNAAAPRGAA